MEGVKILFVDIETAPILGWTWQKYDTDVIDTHRDWSILSFSYKWQDEPVKCLTIKKPSSLNDFINSPDNDKDLIKSLWMLLDKADIVVGHNADQFDIRKINSRFIYYKLYPPSPYKTVDTKKASCRVAANTSNKLNDLGKKYQIGKKVEHEGFELWVKCMSGDKQAWERMERYNNQDVVLLEKLYNFILPWIKNHPNVAMWVEGSACSKCQSRHLQKRGAVYNQTTSYHRIVCMDCGNNMRGVRNERETRPYVSI